MISAPSAQEPDELRLAALSGPDGPPTNSGREVRRGQDSGHLEVDYSSYLMRTSCFKTETIIDCSLLCFEEYEILDAECFVVQWI